MANYPASCSASLPVGNKELRKLANPTAEWQTLTRADAVLNKDTYREALREELIVFLHAANTVDTIIMWVGRGDGDLEVAWNWRDYPTVARDHIGEHDDFWDILEDLANHADTETVTEFEGTTVEAVLATAVVQCQEMVDTARRAAGLHVETDTD